MKPSKIIFARPYRQILQFGNFVSSKAFHFNFKGSGLRDISSMLFYFSLFRPFPTNTLSIYSEPKWRSRDKALLFSNLWLRRRQVGLIPATPALDSALVPREKIRYWCKHRLYATLREQLQNPGVLRRWLILALSLHLNFKVSVSLNVIDPMHWHYYGTALFSNKFYLKENPSSWVR